MDFFTYIIEKALILIPVLIFIGMILKNTPKFPDWLIPWALMALGIVGGGFLVGWTVDGVIQGILVAAGAVYGNQLARQTAKGINGEN